MMWELGGVKLADNHDTVGEKPLHPLFLDERAAM